MPDEKSPGPATIKLKPLVGYDNHDFNSLKRRAPQWSIGRRPKALNIEKSPGAANYKVEKVTRYGKYPSTPAIISIRSKDSKIDRVPGPADYNTIDVSVYRSKSTPKYTIGIKTELSSDYLDGPSPVFDPVSVDVYKQRAPKYTMSCKTKETIDKNSPGPLNYNVGDVKLKTMLKSPAYSYPLKKAPMHLDKRTPGPADYDLTKHNPFSSAPAYTVKHYSKANVYILPNDNC